MDRPFSLPVLSVLIGLLLPLSCAPPDHATPLESAEGNVLTSHEDMMGFLENLAAETGTFTMDTVGLSGEGRPLVVLDFSAGRHQTTGSDGERVKVLIYAQQHGNEPSGKEAAIALARDIATGRFSTFLESVDFYLVPQVNPDGSELEQRRNAAGEDLNRDHLPLSTPEVRALHGLFNSLMPHVTLDVHEYGFASSSWVEEGLYKNFGQQIGALSNPNISMALRTYAWDRVIPEMESALQSRDVDLRRYLVTDGPDARFRYSTTALNDGRNSMGIYNSLSFLIEGRNGLTVESNIRERTRQQLETIKAFLDFFGRHAVEVGEMVEEERRALEEGDISDQVALVMDYVPDPARPQVTVGVIDMESGAERELTIDAFHPQVEATLRVDRPMGYLIPSDRTEILDVLQRHGIPMETVETPIPAVLETYRILDVAETTKEDKPFLAVRVSSVQGEAPLPAGDVVVWCDQLAANLIVSMLEPQSQWGLAPLPEFSALLEVGTEYPIRRIVSVQE
jgi:hypothetical protein